jgi:hypothetical protein
MRIHQMKNLLFAAVTLIGLGCTIQNTTPATPPSASNTFDSTKAQLLKKGTFVGLDGPTSGRASLYDQSGTKYVVLYPFESHSGPDLYVYLAKDIDAADYIRISKLQAISGFQVYKVPASFTPSDYNYIHIWCQMYSVDFARAEIK